MMNDCLPLVIPVINEAFGKNYTGRERIFLNPNEHYINQQDGSEQKRITDSAFTIITDDGRRDKYIFECQSTADGTILVRIFEYIMQEALDSGEVSNNQLTVTVSNATVLFLRSNDNTPDVMKIVINTPGGTVDFDVPVIKMNSYTLDDIFGKGLYFLLPFYIFNFEKKFAIYEKDKAEREKLMEEYAEFSERLYNALMDRKIFEHHRSTILGMSKSVLRKIAAKFKKVKTGVDEIMGGRILDYPGRKEYYEGIEYGKREGMLEKCLEIAHELRGLGVSDTIICKATRLSQEELNML